MVSLGFSKKHNKMFSKFKKILIVPLTFLLVLSCSNDDSILIDESNLLIGVWVEPIYENNIVTFKRANELLDDAYGIAFQINSVFIERHSGWCGTPPLVFGNYEGVWVQDEDMIEITIQDLFSADLITKSWRVIKLDTKNLIIEIIDS
jgi:hypothetical protein